MQRLFFVGVFSCLILLYAMVSRVPTVGQSCPPQHMPLQHTCPKEEPRNQILASSLERQQAVLLEQLGHVQQVQHRLQLELFHKDNRAVSHVDRPIHVLYQFFVSPDRYGSSSVLGISLTPTVAVREPTR